jgi:hypothetical protein
LNQKNTKSSYFVRGIIETNPKEKVFANRRSVRSVALDSLRSIPESRARDEINTSSLKRFFPHSKHNKHLRRSTPLPLTVSPVALGVLALPGVATARAGVVVAVALVDTTGLLASGGETTGLAVLKGG